jgi:hypothetical protein
MASSPDQRLTNFMALPPEIYERITRMLDSSSSLARLSRTCRRLHNFARSSGWRVFVQAHFPSIASTIVFSADSSATSYSFWLDIAHSLVCQSRAWDRRALLASELNPASHMNLQYRSRALNIEARTRSAQTAGYHPVIDCSLEIEGGIRSKREILAIGAGSDLFVRIRSSGSAIDRLELQNGLQDEHGQQISWCSALGTDLKFRHGSDDITSVNIVGKNRTSNKPGIELVIGRASGSLQRIEVSRVSSKTKLLTQFVDRGTSPDPEAGISHKSVVSADINKFITGGSRLASLSKKHIFLYDLDLQGQYVLPQRKLELASEQSSFQAYTNKFLSTSTVAVGGGGGQSSIRVYNTEVDAGSGLLRIFDSMGYSLSDGIVSPRLV